MNEDYFCSDVTSFFTNSSCGIYPTISARSATSGDTCQSKNYPISNYPVASMGVHYRYGNEDENEDRRFDVQASLYNGTGYNRFTGRENVFRVCPKDDGVFGITEVAYNRNRSSYFVGSSVYWGGSSNNIKGVSLTPWACTEQRITDHLSLIAGYSHAFGADTECKDFIGLGALYEIGKCQLGAFTDNANFKKKNEFATELTCKIPISRHIDIQPTAHLITYDSKLHCIGMLRMALSY